jgi:DNA-binding response OmpR family regulator
MVTDMLEILMVEDDREQADLIMDTAKVCRSAIRWGVAEDGEGALERLRRAELARPGLVLLDLHLPKLGGIDVLRAIKNDARLKGMPVIIMSSSRDEADIQAVYELGANCYIAKPGSFEGLCSLVRFLEAFLTLPQKGDGATAPNPGSPAHSQN